MSDNQACANTDRALYYLAPDDGWGVRSIHVTEGGNVGVNVNGLVFVKTIPEWHALACVKDTPSPPDGESLRSSIVDDHWIGKHFTGLGVAIRKRDDPPIPGEPFMSMDDAKELTKLAVKTTIESLRSELEQVRAWAEDEQHKRHAAEEKLVAVRSELEGLRARSHLFDYIKNSGDELAAAKATIEHMGGALGREIELHAEARAELERVKAERDALSLDLERVQTELDVAEADLSRMREALERSVVALPPHKHLCPNCGSHIAAFDRAADELRSLSLRIQELEKGLRWALNEIADGDEDETPEHECGFATNPPAGYCEFHDKYWQYRRLLGATKEAK